MGDYTVTNLKADVEDLAPKFGMPAGIEARFARRALGAERLGLSYQRLDPGVRMPFGHKHAEQEEIYLVVSGSARLKLDDEVVELGPWDAVRMSSDTMRNVEAGAAGVELLAFGAGDPGDADLTPGWWSD